MCLATCTGAVCATLDCNPKGRAYCMCGVREELHKSALVKCSMQSAQSGCNAFTSRCASTALASYAKKG